MSISRIKEIERKMQAKMPQEMPPILTLVHEPERGGWTTDGPESAFSILGAALDKSRIFLTDEEADALADSGQYSHVFRIIGVPTPWGDREPMEYLAELGLTWDDWIYFRDHREGKKWEEYVQLKKNGSCPAAPCTE